MIAHIVYYIIQTFLWQRDASAGSNCKFDVALESPLPAFPLLRPLTTYDGHVIVNLGAYVVIKTSFWGLEHQDQLSKTEVRAILGGASYGYRQYVEDKDDGLITYLKKQGKTFFNL